MPDLQKPDPLNIPQAARPSIHMARIEAREQIRDMRHEFGADALARLKAQPHTFDKAEATMRMFEKMQPAWKSDPVAPATPRPQPLFREAKVFPMGPVNPGPPTPDSGAFFLQQFELYSVDASHVGIAPSTVIGRWPDGMDGKTPVILGAGSGDYVYVHVHVQDGGSPPIDTREILAGGGTPSDDPANGDYYWTLGQVTVSDGVMTCEQYQFGPISQLVVNENPTNADLGAVKGSSSQDGPVYLARIAGSGATTVTNDTADIVISSPPPTL